MPGGRHNPHSPPTPSQTDHRPWPRGPASAQSGKWSQAATAGPTRASPRGHRLHSQAPTPVCSQAAAHPPKHTAKDLVGGGREGTNGWEILPTSQYWAAGPAHRTGPLAGGNPVWPLSPSSSCVHRLSFPAGIHRLQRVQGPRGTLLAREDCMQGRDLQWFWGSRTQVCVGAEIYQFGGCHLSW